MKSLVIIISLLIIFLLLYLIITKKTKKREEKIIDADFEDLDKKKWKIMLKNYTIACSITFKVFWVFLFELSFLANDIAEATHKHPSPITTAW